MERFDIPLEDLFLDLENPRLGAVSTQLEALEGLIGLGITYFKNMMQSIKQNGLDPGDSFYVLEDLTDEESFIVVDGNLRLAALKVLAEPAILQGIKLSEGHIRQLTSIASDYDLRIGEAVSCVRFENRETADAWIKRRHGRDLAGEGRLNWGTLEIERFQRDRTVLDVISFVERNSTLDDSSWTATKSAVQAGPTILRRFLDSKAGKSWFASSVQIEPDGTRLPAFGRDPKFVLRVLEQLFKDIAANVVNTRTYNKAEDIAGYFEGLPAELHPEGGTPSKTLFRDSTITDSAVRPRQSAGSSAAKQADNSKQTAKTTKAKPPRLTLAEKRHLFTQPETVKGQRLVHESSRLNVRDFPLSGAFLLRAFLEHTIDSYMARHSLPRMDGKRPLELKVRAVKVIDHIIQNSPNKSADAQGLRGAQRLLSNTTDPTSIQALNDYHHDRYQIPPADALRNAWDASVPLFVEVWGAAK